MSRPIDNHLARKQAHEHPAGEVMDNRELLSHLVKYHGWSLEMVRQRGYREDGGYAEGFHRNLHATASLDPPSERRSLPEEF